MSEHNPQIYPKHIGDRRPIPLIVWLLGRLKPPLVFTNCVSYHNIEAASFEYWSYDITLPPAAGHGGEDE